jgi:hypothetical protein
VSRKLQGIDAHAAKLGHQEQLVVPPYACRTM